MDAFLAIASKRDVKTFSSRAIPAEVEARILDAGRLSGSAMNRQPWRFAVVRNLTLRERLATTVYAPENVRTCALVVAVVGRGKGPVAFDCGRAAQNMMLAAWNERVASTPNGIASREDAERALGLADGESLQIVLSFGYPARQTNPESRAAADWSARANRRAPDEVVSELP